MFVSLNGKMLGIFMPNFDPDGVICVFQPARVKSALLLRFRINSEIMNEARKTYIGTKSFAAGVIQFTWT